MYFLEEQQQVFPKILHHERLLQALSVQDSRVCPRSCSTGLLLCA